MRAFAVVGANWGDEGKGLVTDFLCRVSDTRLVVRFNGGAQAGHTVVHPDGRRHVFSHFGAGTLAGAATYLSRFFVCNPVLYGQELDKLQRLLGPREMPLLIVDPDCPVTTPFDMMVNQWAEATRGSSRHGSCGVGFNETIERNGVERFSLRVSDLYDGAALGKRLSDIWHDWMPGRLRELGVFEGVMLEHDLGAISARFARDIYRFLSTVAAAGRLRGGDVPSRVIFEGAQGLMLDQGNTADFPHLTRSNTGLTNVLQLAQEFGVKELQAVYVSRTYATRHGAGPLPMEWPGRPDEVKPDATNIEHPFQGGLRYGPIDPVALDQRVLTDVAKACCFAPFPIVPTMAWTHLDEMLIPDGCSIGPMLKARGPTARDVELCAPPVKVTV